MRMKALVPLLIFLALAAAPLFLTMMLGEGMRAGVAPEVQGIHEWFNSDPLTIAGLRGKVVLVDFWTYSCVNCLRTLPYLRAWDERYREQGLVIIGVHTPEFDFEKSVENVKAAVRDLRIGYPVALDSDKKTWKAYANRYWPHKYLIDHQGNIRYEQIGEGGYPEMEGTIRNLLAESGAQLEEGLTRVAAEEVIFTEVKTPEIYLGVDRGGFLGNPRGFKLGPIEYIEPARLEENLFYLVGKWQAGMERTEFVGEGEGRLLLRYTAKSVNFVAGAPGRTVVAEVLLDGMPLAPHNAGRDITFDDRGRSLLPVGMQRLYSVVHDRNGYGTHTLTLIFKQRGLEAYTFTFG